MKDFQDVIVVHCHYSLVVLASLVNGIVNVNGKMSREICKISCQ